MSLPPVNPEKSVSGIAVDPRTQDRIVPESKRVDGSVRKERKVRPGFTPQEDISRFRGSRQQQMDRTALPKGHIMGWVAPSSENQSKKTSTISKSAKKNEKRREKKREEKERIIKDNWEDEDEDTPATSRSDTVSPSHITPPDVDKSEKTGADALANTMASLSVDK